jgi:hypothetical protein
MSKLKNKIKEGLERVMHEEEDNFDIENTKREIDKTIDPMPIAPDQKDILKAKALNKELEDDEEISEDNQGGGLTEMKPVNRPKLQQKKNPEYNPDPSIDPRTGRKRIIPLQKQNPEYNPDPSIDPRTGRKRIIPFQKPNPSLDEYNDDLGDIPTGMDVEAGAVNYDELNRLIDDLNASGEFEDGDEMGGNLEKQGGEDILPFESVNPRMTKDELMESVMRKTKKTPKVIKRIKVKDIKNGK